MIKHRETRETNTRLTLPWLWPARLTWWLLLFSGLVIFVLLLPDSIAAYRQVCQQPREVCAQLGRPLSAELVEALAIRGISAATYATMAVGLPLFSAIIWWIVGLLIYWRKSDDWLALLTSLCLILTGFTLGTTMALNNALLTWSYLTYVLTILPFWLFAVFFALFPNGRLVPQAIRWLLPLWLVLITIPWAQLGFSSRLTLALDILIWLPFWFGGILAQWYRYRTISTPTERSQTRWVMFGLGVVAFGLLVNIIIALAAPTLALIVQNSNWIALAFTAVPVSIGIAILRYQRWDIDVLIRKTLVYAVLTGLLALVYFGSVVLLQQLFAGLIGQRSVVAVVLSTLLIAALFTPLRRRIQKIIDRCFFRQRYDAQQVLVSFGAAVHNETDPDQLTAELVRVVQETMQPKTIKIWLSPARKEKTEQAVRV